jgi:hypothetical protein
LPEESNSNSSGQPCQRKATAIQVVSLALSEESNSNSSGQPCQRKATAILEVPHCMQETSYRYAGGMHEKRHKTLTKNQLGEKMDAGWRQQGYNWKSLQDGKNRGGTDCNCIRRHAKRGNMDATGIGKGCKMEATVTSPRGMQDSLRWTQQG